MQKIIDIVKDLVLSINNNVIVSSVNDLSNGLYELVTCDYKHINRCNDVSIDSNTYKVTGYTDNGFIVRASTLPVIGTYVVGDMSFVHGNYTDANKAMLMMDEENINFSNTVFFVSSPLRESVNYDSSSNLKTCVSIQLLLLVSNDSYNWCPSDHYDIAINPMRNLSDLIIDRINSRKSDFEKTNSSGLLSLIDVGVTKGNSPSDGDLFDYTFSGVLMTFDLKIKNTHKCCTTK